ncbi:hypothetical protein E4L95_09880 [Paracoccus liaowanqingii]|uniref:Uncharacterized protein n=1 Tax=Paracoccus liaowanqingii TaxID=2560053 RepID=A0A4Z1C3U2_9RHOB|nr:hypothetical protein [Paracoccus liaowanqingii]TGN61598.1 hypothetical protein E4L95_09880 [Paracoccus liaowanqingii]
MGVHYVGKRMPLDKVSPLPGTAEKRSDPAFSPVLHAALPAANVPLRMRLLPACDLGLTMGHAGQHADLSGIEEKTEVTTLLWGTGQMGRKRAGADQHFDHDKTPFTEQGLIHAFGVPSGTKAGAARFPQVPDIRDRRVSKTIVWFTVPEYPEWGRTGKCGETEGGQCTIQMNRSKQAT